MSDRISKDTCPTCKKSVIFVRELKPNGHYGIIAYHEDEILSGNPEQVETTKAYRRHRMSFLHKAEEKKTIKVRGGSVSEPVISKPVESTALVSVKSELPKKEKVVIEPKKDVILPEKSSTKPIVDINGLNHSTYRILGEVLKVLTKAGWTDEQLKVPRFDITSNGQSIENLLRVASKYVDIVEAGKPIIIPA